MVYQLSRGGLFDRAVFVNPRAVWLRDSNGEARDLGTRVRDAFGSLPRRYDDKIQIMSMLHFLPFKGQIPIGYRLELELFRRVLRACVGGKRFVLLNNHPNFFSRELLQELMDDAVLSAYDLSDDFVEYHRDPEHREIIQESVRYSCENSDVVLAVNDHVREKYRPYNANIHSIWNSTNFANFHRPSFRPVPELEALRATGKPLIGYTGIVNSVRINYELLRELLEARPEWNFVFIGSSDPSFRELAATNPNLHHLNQVDYEDLPDRIHAFDVAMVPFQVNEHTRGNDLLKFSDYLATGKPVVTTATGGADRYGDLLRVARDSQHFLALLDDALHNDAEDRVRRGVDYARANSWSARAMEIESIFVEALRARAAQPAS